MKATAIVCAHNPRMDYLSRVLDSLKRQTLSKSDWEILVVDNASDEPLAGRVDLSWHPNGRVLQEKSLGLTNARLRGIGESRGAILTFVDDDNVLDSNYLAESLRIATKWPQLGAWGGSIVPEFEIPLPTHLEPYVSCLSVREITTARWSNVWNCQEAEPRGAGLCLRQAAAVAYAEFYRRSPLPVDDRKGAMLMSGGDTEIAYLVCSLGSGMGVFPELRLLHLIPEGRLNEDYFVKISQGLETSSMILLYKWGQIRPASPFSAFGIMRFVRHYFFSRGLGRNLALARIRAMIAARKIISARAKLASSF